MTTITSLSTLVHTSLNKLAIVEEGNTIPSVEQVKRWHENNFRICISANSEIFEGNIQRIPSLQFAAYNDILSFMVNDSNFKYPVYVSVSDITHFERREEVAVPLTSEMTKELIFLKSGQEKFKVDYELLRRKIPYFRDLFEFQTLFGEKSPNDEIDLSSSLSPNQLKLILEYVYGILDLDLLSGSDVIDLFKTAGFLSLKELQDELKSRYHFIDQISEGSPQLTLQCRKLPLSSIHYQPSAYSEALGIYGILSALEWALDLKVTVNKLYICDINDEDLSILVEYLKGKETQIESLTIEHNNAFFYLTDESAPLFEPLLKELPSLKEFVMQNQKIGDKSLIAIGRALITHDNLEKLELTNSMLVKDKNSRNFSSQAFDLFTEQLAENHILKSLSLKNSVRGQSLQKNGRYVNALSRNTSLEHLCLENIGLEDSGAAGLAVVIQHNPHLKTMNLRGSAITELGIKELKAALATHPSLTDVSLFDKWCSFFYPSRNLVQEREEEKRSQRMRQENTKMLSEFVSMIPNSNLALTEAENRWEVIGRAQYKSGFLEMQTAIALSNTIEKLLKSDPKKRLVFPTESRDPKNRGQYRVIISDTLVNTISLEMKKYDEGRPSVFE
jgi:hypothetical protein